MITLSLNTVFEGSANRNVGFSDRTNAFPSPIQHTNQN
jgi:hypothetical protein